MLTHLRKISHIFHLPIPLRKLSFSFDLDSDLDSGSDSSSLASYFDCVTDINSPSK